MMTSQCYYVHTEFTTTPFNTMTVLQCNSFSRNISQRKGEKNELLFGIKPIATKVIKQEECMRIITLKLFMNTKYPLDLG